MPDHVLSAAAPGSQEGAGEGDHALAARRRTAIRLATRERLLFALAALAAAFAAAFVPVLVGLGRMREQLAYLHEHEDQMRVALDIAAEIRGLYSPQAQRDVPRASRADARKKLFDQIRRLTDVVDEEEAIGWIAAVAAGARELDRRAQGDLGAAGAPDAKLRGASLDRLLFEVEVNADRFFAFLRDRVAEQSDTVRDLRQRTLQLAIAFVTATLLLAAALAAYLSQRIAVPLGVLGAGAARIASGDLATRIELSRADEFGALAAEFNAMAAALQANQEKLVRSEKLAGLGRVAAGIAHELNNPLQVILGYVSLDRDRAQGAVAQHLARIEREAVRCKEIVEALLQLSRPASAGALEPVELRDVADEVVEAVRMELRGAAPAISVEGAGAALGTPQRFHHILRNLVKNAADAAGPGGGVRVEVTAAGSHVRVAVSDSGPGISPELRDRIFEPFFTTKTEGTGLGLAVARAAATALGGELDLDASEQGGARFTLRVPAAGAQAVHA